MDTCDIDSEQDMWRTFRKDTKQRKNNDAAFRKMFPNGHRTSLRVIIQEFANIQRNEGRIDFSDRTILDDLHPDAFDVILEHGQDYRPMKWSTFPTLEPGFGQCYANAWKLMEARELVYVEGIVCGVLAYPMLHAWNCKRTDSEAAIDWSHCSGSHWSRYFGIPFTKQEHDRLHQASAHGGTNLIALFHREYFGDIKDVMQDMLRNRST